MRRGTHHIARDRVGSLLLVPRRWGTTTLKSPTRLLTPLVAGAQSRWSVRETGCCDAERWRLASKTARCEHFSSSHSAAAVVSDDDDDDDVIPEEQQQQQLGTTTTKEQFFQCRVNPQENRAISKVLKYALSRNPEIFDSTSPVEPPVALFYDLDAFDALLDACHTSFGPNFKHYVAAKANPVASMLRRASDKGFGVEAASMGEVLLAREKVGVKDVVFDGPAKTRAELAFALRSNIRCHLDNFDEFDRAVSLLGELDDQEASPQPRRLGFRVNPSNVGEGRVASLSVSTPDSKFGVDVSDRDTRSKLVQIYKDSPFLDSIHVHVGSGFDGLAGADQTLATGVRVALDLALEINAAVPGRVRTIDIGGGLPVNYSNDAFFSSDNNNNYYEASTHKTSSSSSSSSSSPDFFAYAAALRQRCPELFVLPPTTSSSSEEGGETDDERKRNQAFFTVLTEFGQSLNAKAGFLASRVEFVKKEPSRRSNLAVLHFGADVCVRQAYAGRDHPRRFAAFDAATGAHKPPETAPGDDGVSRRTKPWSLGGPLCFQGDFVSRDSRGDLPDDLAPGDLVVMKDAGANTLSLFSRHCSRFAPPVYGFRWGTANDDDDGLPPIRDVVELKPREDLDAIAAFWGCSLLPTTTSD